MTKSSDHLSGQRRAEVDEEWPRGSSALWVRVVLQIKYGVGWVAGSYKGGRRFYKPIETKRDPLIYSDITKVLIGYQGRWPDGED